MGRAIDQLRSMLQTSFGSLYTVVPTTTGVKVRKGNGMYVEPLELARVVEILEEVVDEYDEDVARYQQKYQTTSNSDED